MAKISVIVPIYKVEKYIRKCVDSLVGQTLSDIEIILVDDGSPDDCGAICDAYAKQDARIKVIHKPNEGLSEARNVGIKAATSEYIGFVDGDDYVAPDMYEVLYKNITEQNADVAVCGLYDCYVDRKVPQFSGQDEFLILNNKEALGAALEGVKFSVNAVNKLYKKGLFAEVKFPKGRLSEDAFTIPKVLASATTVVFDSSPKYYYMHRGESITTSAFKRQDFDVVAAYEQNLELVKKDFADLTKQAEFRLMWAYTYVFDKMVLSENLEDPQSYEEVLKKLRANTPQMLMNSCFSLRRKAAMLALWRCPGLYKKLLRWQKASRARLND